MSSTSDFIAWQRSRSCRKTITKGRPIIMKEWDKLFAEATEKDTKEGKEFTIDETDCEIYDCENSEYDENEENENDSEMPLNLCYKSKTVPVINNHIDTSENILKFPTNRKTIGNFCQPYETSNQVSCTVPNFQSNNYQEDFMPEEINSFNNNKPSEKQSCDKNEDNENVKNRKISSNKINPSCSLNNRTPMKEVNHLNSLTLLETKKNSSENNNQPKILEKSSKNKSTATPTSSQNDVGSKSKKIQENNMKNIDNKSVKSKTDSVCDYTEVNNEKQCTIEQKFVKNSQGKNQVRFAVPVTPQKVKNVGKIIVVNGKSYQVLAPLGKGGSSCVYLVLNTNNELLAVKCVRLSGLTESIKNDYLNEIQHLMRMQHSKHVIRLFDHQYVEAHKLLFAVMEKGDTDLSRFLKDKAASEEGITPELILYYWNEMLLAVKSIHDNNIIHRDLKPANFLLVSGRLKLIDFGIASSIQNEQTSILMDTQSGTFNYMSPEALLDLGSDNEIVLKIGRKSDVWSLGCILYYFLYKKTPYQDIVKPLQKMKAITDPNYTVKFPKLPGVPDILIESCKRCLVHDRKKRASIEELLELKNRPLLTLSQVLTKLKSTLSEAEYCKAEKALSEEITTNEN